MEDLRQEILSFFVTSAPATGLNLIEITKGLVGTGIKTTEHDVRLSIDKIEKDYLKFEAGRFFLTGEGVLFVNAGGYNIAPIEKNQEEPSMQGIHVPVEAHEEYVAARVSPEDKTPCDEEAVTGNEDKEESSQEPVAAESKPMADIRDKILWLMDTAPDGSVWSVEKITQFLCNHPSMFPPRTYGRSQVSTNEGEVQHNLNGIDKAYLGFGSGRYSITLPGRNFIRAGGYKAAAEKAEGEPPIVRSTAARDFIFGPLQNELKAIEENKQRIQGLNPDDLAKKMKKATNQIMLFMLLLKIYNIGRSIFEVTMSILIVIAIGAYVYQLNLWLFLAAIIVGVIIGTVASIIKSKKKR